MVEKKQDNSGLRAKDETVSGPTPSDGGRCEEKQRRDDSREGQVSPDAGARDAVILDMDGTLLDSTYHHALAWYRAMASVGLHPPFWKVHRAIGLGGDRLPAHVLGDDVEARSGDELRDAWSREYDRLWPEVRPLDGARELCQSIRDAGMLVLIASSSDEEMVTRALERVGIEGLADAVTTSDDAEFSKPAPDLLQAVLSKAGNPRRAVMVGDTTYDVESATAIGLACAAVRSGGFSSQELEAVGAASVVDSPADLVGFDWAAVLAEPSGPRRD